MDDEPIEIPKTKWWRAPTARSVLIGFSSVLVALRVFLFVLQRSSGPAIVAPPTTLVPRGATATATATAARPRPTSRRAAKLFRLDDAAPLPIALAPEASADETAEDLFVALENTVFVATRGQGRGFVRSLTPKGVWKTELTVDLPEDERIVLAGRTPKDVWVAVGATLRHFDGKQWTTVAAPSDKRIVGMSEALDGLLVVTRPSMVSTRVDRRRGETWVEEPIPSGVAIRSLSNGASTALALGVDIQGSSTMLVRSEGAWTSQPLPLDEPDCAWARNTRDVYAAASHRLHHFDGERWTTDERSIDPVRIAGTPELLFVLAEAND